MKKTNNTAKGIMCILFSALSFSGMSIFINMSGDVPVMQKVSGRISTLCSKDFPLIKKVIEFYAKKSII